MVTQARWLRSPSVTHQEWAAVLGIWLMVLWSVPCAVGQAVAVVLHSGRGVRGPRTSSAGFGWQSEGAGGTGKGCPIPELTHVGGGGAEEKIDTASCGEE